jgi:glycosyltransferase involved in cell wall biosynthesis
MKLIIQIPCFNEADSLPTTLKDIPESIPGFDCVEILIIDDGSSDDTVRVARQNGVSHVVKHNRNRGLAAAFMTGIETAISLGADVIVNTDADNQYRGCDIEQLVKPILNGRFDMVIGARPINDISDFSTVKRVLQRLGSLVVRVASNSTIEDAPSGFRAITKEAAKKLVVFDEYTYTLETIIQAGKKNIAITSVPIGVNGEMRPSRLVKSNFDYIKRSIITIIRIFVVYRPFRFFFAIGSTLLLFGTLLGLRFLYYYFTGDGSGHIQSVILAGVFLIAGFQTVLIAFIADLLAANRSLLEDIRTRVHQKHKV